MIKGFHHVAFYAHDFDRSYEFYVDGLGLEEKYLWEMDNGNRAVMIDTGDDNYIEIFEGGENDREQGILIHFALATDDCDSAFNAACEAGAEVKMEPQDVELTHKDPFTVRVAFCKGPDGEEIEFFQKKE